MSRLTAPIIFIKEIIKRKTGYVATYHPTDGHILIEKWVDPILLDPSKKNEESREKKSYLLTFLMTIYIRLCHAAVIANATTEFPYALMAHLNDSLKKKNKRYCQQMTNHVCIDGLAYHVNFQLRIRPTLIFAILALEGPQICMKAQKLSTL